MNVTIKIEDALCRKARHRAVDRGLSLSGWIAQLLRKELAAEEPIRGGLLEALAMDDLDDDVLEAAKALATQEKKPLHEVLSAMIRSAIEPPPGTRFERNGIPLFPVSQGARPVTAEIVKELLEDVP